MSLGDPVAPKHIVYVVPFLGRKIGLFANVGCDADGSNVAVCIGFSHLTEGRLSSKLLPDDFSAEVGRRIVAPQRTFPISAAGTSASLRTSS